MEKRNETFEKKQENQAEETGNVSQNAEAIVQECLQQMYTAAGEEDALVQALSCLGERLHCDRACVLLVRNNRWVNMDLEWCREGIASQKRQIQNEPLENFNWSPSFLSREDAALLADIEEIRNEYPSFYAQMKSRQVDSMIAMPVPVEKHCTGVIHLENPDLSLTDDAFYALRQIRRHIGIQLKRRDMLHQLEEMSFHDPLTGAFNRNALTELYQRPLEAESVGVIYCDVSGLKQVNDTQGHEEGDEMIIQCCQLIRRTIRTDRIYRMGGDEFLALCFNSRKEDVEHDFETLKHEISRSRHHIAVGYVWSDEAPLMLEPLIAAADHEMYLDKQEYYSTRDYFARMARESADKHHVTPDAEENTAFQKYVKNYYFDAEALLKSLTINNLNQFFFFGDIKKNYFYVSDHMRDRFGFDSNLMLNLPHHWEQRICDEEYKRINSQAVEKLFCEKQDSYELLHLVQDVHGNRIWVHNSGTLQWNTDRTVPLFLSGRITLQDKDYTIDQISGFQKDYKALAHLEELRQRGEQPTVIGFCLNHFSRINQDGGTYYGNMLFYHVGNHLQSKLRGQMTFYRLDGNRCVAVLEPEQAERREALLEEIRAIIEEEYRAIEVYDRNPVSFAILQDTRNMGTAREFLETVCERIDMARQMPNLPYVSESEELKKEIEQTGQMVATLRKNVQNQMENFRILIQPAIHADTGKLAGGESLLRWRYKGRDVLPEQLLPLLEAEGLMAQVDRWVIEQTVNAQIRLRNCRKDFLVGFNVSDQVLQSKGFLDFLRQTLSRCELQEGGFYIEIKEEHLLSHEGHIEPFLDECKKMGINVMQKGFGALSSLLKAGIDRSTDAVKLNISLLSELKTEEEQIKYLQSLVYLCHQFGKAVSIIGTEDEDGCRKAGSCSCDYIQGYSYYYPLELSEVYALLLTQKDE